MAAIEVGRKCIKTAGREAGKECEIVAIIDENFVEVKGDEVTNCSTRPPSLRETVTR